MPMCQASGTLRCDRCQIILGLPEMLAPHGGCIMCAPEADQWSNGEIAVRPSALGSCPVLTTASLQPIPFRFLGDFAMWDADEAQEAPQGPCEQTSDDWEESSSSDSDESWCPDESWDERSSDSGMTLEPMDWESGGSPSSDHCCLQL